MLTLNQEEWIAHVGGLLRTLLVTDRARAEAMAAHMGLADLPEYAALCVLQYLVDHHGDDVDVPGSVDEDEDN